MDDIAHENYNLGKLLQRALDDDGVEGDVAWSMFARIAKGRKGKIMFLSPDDHDPLVPYILELQEKIDAKTEELSTLRKKISKQSKTLDALSKSWGRM